MGLDRRLRKGAAVLALSLFLGILLSTATFIVSLRRVAFGGYQDPLLSSDERELLRRKEPFDLSLNGSRVLLVLIDGFGWDAHERLESLFDDDPQFAEDSVLTEMECSLPSVSHPNYVTLVSGAAPEFHGITTNYAPNSHMYEIMPDSIYTSARHIKKRVGVIGQMAWDGIARSGLELLDGNGATPHSFVKEGNWDGAPDPFKPWSAHDRLWLETAIKALGDEDDPWGLLSLYQGNLDAVGHAFGTDSKFYADSVADMLAMIQKVKAHIDSNTTLVVVADHGHVKAGGHGGILPIVTTVPLLIYRSGSSLSKKVSLPLSRISNQDVAPTIAALMGAPIPGSAFGGIAPSALPLIDNLSLVHADLLKQKQALGQAMIRRTGGDPSTLGKLNASEITEAIQEARGVAIVRDTLRNMLIASIVCVVWFVIAVLAVNRLTPINVVASVKELFTRRTQGVSLRAALISSLLYWILVWSVYWIATAIRGRLVGYESVPFSWDSSLWNSTADCLVPLISVLIIGSVIAALCRFVLINLLISRRPVPWSPDPSGALALARLQLAILTLCASLAILTLQSLDGILLPFVIPIQWITPTIHVFRWRILIVFVTFLPYGLVNLVDCIMLAIPRCGPSEAEWILAPEIVGTKPSCESDELWVSLTEVEQEHLI